MLFDLRSPGRRRLIKTVYLFLAILIGVGLIGFGVGTGGNFGGLFSAAANGGGSAGAGGVKIQKQLTKAQKQAKASPNSPVAWLKVGKAAYQLAVLPGNYLSGSGYTSGGHAALNKLKVAWNHYLELAPAKYNLTFAQEVAAGFAPPPNGVGDYQTAESAQGIIAELKPTATQYEFLAYYAYLAKDFNGGDIAATKALSLTPKKQRNSLAQTLAGIRAQASGATGATGATGST
jgi:hypothetical protein